MNLNTESLKVLEDVRRHASRALLCEILEGGYDTQAMSYMICGYYFSCIDRIDGDSIEWSKVDWLEIAKLSTGVYAK